MGTEYNITSFHYRTRGLEYGSVLCCFELPEESIEKFKIHLSELNYQYRDVTDDIAYQQYLHP